MSSVRWPAGKPVGTLQAPAYDDFTIDGRTAIMVHQAEPDALAAAVERLAHDPDLSRAIGRRGRRGGAGIRRRACRTEDGCRLLRRPAGGATRDGVGQAFESGLR